MPLSCGSRPASDDGDAHFGEEIPVRREVPRGRIEELEPGEVRGSAAVADQRRVERPAQFVECDEVLALITDDRDGFGDRGECPLQTRSGRAGFRGAAPVPTRGGDAVGVSGEIEKVRVLGIAQL